MIQSSDIEGVPHLRILCALCEVARYVTHEISSFLTTDVLSEYVENFWTYSTEELFSSSVNEIQDPSAVVPYGVCVWNKATDRRNVYMRKPFDAPVSDLEHRFMEGVRGILAFIWHSVRCPYFYATQIDNLNGTLGWFWQCLIGFDPVKREENHARLTRIFLHTIHGC